MGRRRTGNYRKRGDHSYELMVTIGKKADGSRNRLTRTVQAKDDREAQRLLVLFVDECERENMQVESSITFREFIDIWKRDYAELRNKKSTRVTDYQNIENNLKAFMPKKLKDIKKSDVREWVSYLHTERGLSPKTIKNNFSLLHGILDRAVEWEYIMRNPADKVTLPKCHKTEVDFYDDKEVLQLLKILEEVPDKEMSLKVAILLAMFGGLRRGEICGLDVDDVFFTINAVHVHQERLKYGEGSVYTETTKTIQSDRVVSLPVYVMREIEKLLAHYESEKKRLGDLWGDSPALIKNQSGGNIYPPKVLEWFSNLQKKNGLRHIKLHALRHTNTTLLRSLGAKLEDLSNHLGHSVPSTTLDIYSHLYKDTESLLAKMIDTFLEANGGSIGGKKNPNPDRDWDFNNDIGGGHGTRMSTPPVQTLKNKEVSSAVPFVPSAVPRRISK